jgi:hypothetical protein
MAHKSSDELIAILTAKSADYVKEALEAAQTALDKTTY